MSSFIREKIIKKELQKPIHSIDGFAAVMSDTYQDVHPQYQPYRTVRYKANSHITPNELNVNTTGQLFLNITDLEFIYFMDVHHTQGVTYHNRLPKGYLPKINVVVKENEKYVKRPKKLFTKKYLANITKQMYCKTVKSSW